MTTPDDLLSSDFREWLASAMKDRGWRQEDLERVSGLSQATISKLLLGKTTNPSLDTARKLGKAFDMTVDEMVAKLVRTSQD